MHRKLIFNHYIPQYYLKGFCQESGEKIWVYDKKESKTFPVNVEKIARERGFYSQDLEKNLTENIENPANPVIKKIREKREILTTDEKITLSKYIAVMWKRVPAGKNLLKERAPIIASNFREMNSRKFEEAVAKNPTNEDLYRQIKEKYNRYLDELSQNPPDVIWQGAITDEESTQKLVDCIASMTWRFLTVDQEPVFLTGDNPVYFPPEIGMGNADSELSFPISSHVTLWATRRLDLQEGYFPTKMRIVKEMNRRIASETTRYVFRAKEEDWILPLIKKKKWHLNRSLQI